MSNPEKSTEGRPPSGAAYCSDIPSDGDNRANLYAPDRGKIVICKRWFKDGGSEIVLGRRMTNRPWTSHTDLSKDAWWEGLGEKSGCNWSDATVEWWCPIAMPQPCVPVQKSAYGSLHILLRRANGQITRRYFAWRNGNWHMPGNDFGETAHAMGDLGWSYERPIGTCVIENQDDTDTAAERRLSSSPNEKLCNAPGSGASPKPETL